MSRPALRIVAAVFAVACFPGSVQAQGLLVAAMAQADQLPMESALSTAHLLAFAEPTFALDSALLAAQANDEILSANAAAEEMINDGDSEDAAPASEPPRSLLAAFAMKLRDIRYRRGGREPSTGFDCSGFVHYVFSHSLGLDLPSDSASQFQAGIKIARTEMKTGDLVFFHIHGKRVSHVGIYLDDGRFIHSPSTGERVRVDHLNDAYWSKRFAGARRPNILS